MASKTLVSKYVKLRLTTETFDTPRIVMNLDVQKDYVRTKNVFLPRL